ncbi:MAG TPA: polysaccharide deacetylase family protein [Burkholderiales bacterium]|nr:polysaccharide deacetylase family protein [Burkholderiales bacterium]
MTSRGDSILMYHGTPRRDAAHLERQLRALGMLFHIVPLEELTRPRPNGRRIALTFDDGLKSNVEVAYPILRKLGLPATFYVCPGLIESGGWLWNHEARQRLLSLPAPALAELAATVGGPAEVEALVEWMKGLKLPARVKVEEAIRAATRDFRPTPEQRDEFEIAGWDDLRKLDPRVVTIGSHTLSHPILTSLAPDEVDRELRESRSVLEHRLQREVKNFCYPNGDLDDDAVKAARRYYDSAVTVEQGSLDHDVDPHRMPRFAARPRDTLRLARRLAFG